MAGYVGAHENRCGYSDGVYTDYLDEYIWREMVLEGKAEDPIYAAELADDVVASDADRRNQYVTSNGYLGSVPREGDAFGFVQTRSGYLDEIMYGGVNANAAKYITYPEWSAQPPSEEVAAAREQFLKDVADRKAYLATLTPETVPYREPSIRVTGGYDVGFDMDIQPMEGAERFTSNSAAFDILSCVTPEDLLAFQQAGGDVQKGETSVSKSDQETIAWNAQEKLKHMKGCTINTLIPEHDFMTADELKTLEYDDLVNVFATVMFCETESHAREKQGEDINAQAYADYRALIYSNAEASGVDVTKLRADSQAALEKALVVNQIELKLNRSAVQAGQTNIVAPEDFFTGAELEVVPEEWAMPVFTLARTSKEFAHMRADRGENIDTQQYDDYYDLVCQKFTGNGFNVEKLNVDSCKLTAAAKLECLSENPSVFPDPTLLLTEDELQTLDNDQLAEQFTFARMCSGSYPDWQPSVVNNEPIESTGVEWMDTMQLALRNGVNTTSVSQEDMAAYDDYYARLQSVCESRGFDIATLEQESDNYITEARKANLFSLKGVGINIRMLSSVNRVNEQALVHYMSLSPMEQQMTTRFKDVLTDVPTQSASGAGRWDGARMDREPLQKNADTLITQSFNLSKFFEGDMVTNMEALRSGDTSRFMDTNEYSVDLMAEMNVGTPYEVKTYSFYDKDNNHLMYCQSPYLGNFIYDGNDWGIGYKELEPHSEYNSGDETIRIPVFQYVGDLQADWQHGQLSPAGILVSGKGDFGEAFVSNAKSAGNAVINAIDILGIIDDDPIDNSDGYTMDQQVSIPYGVKNLDYTFAGNSELQLVPGIPETVESMHCTFANCSELYDASWQFGDSDGWKLPSNLQDFSYTFMGCKQLECNKLGTFPKELLTIEGAFNGCERILDKKVWENWTLDLDAIFGKTVEGDWSDSPYLMEEFSMPVDESTSNKMKQNYEREEAERDAFQAEFSKPENLAQQPEEVVHKWEDAKAAEVAVRTEKVLDAEMTVRSMDTMSKQELNENSFMAFLQRAVIDVGSFAILKGVTKGISGSNLLGWIGGLGGTALLRMTGILPASIEPALNWIKDNFIKSESGKASMDKVINFIHVPDEKDRAAVEKEQMSRYAPVALDDSMVRSAWSADVFYDDNEVRDAMKVNGKAVASYGVLQYWGETNEDLGAHVKSSLAEPLAAAEAVFDEKMAHGDGYDWPEEMRRYYWQQLYGLEGYCEGAQEGIQETYGTSGKVSDKLFTSNCGCYGHSKKDEENQARMKSAEAGLAGFDCAHATAIMDSLVRMDSKYHFMTEEDWLKIGQLNIYGVDTGSLYMYQEGQGLYPEVMGDYLDGGTMTPEAYDELMLSGGTSEKTQSKQLKQVNVEQQATVPEISKDTQEPTAVEEVKPKESAVQQHATKSSQDKHDERVKQAEAVSAGVESGKDEAQADDSYDHSSK